MNTANQFYAEAMQQTSIAMKYAKNAQFWQIILETLYEEDPANYSRGELKRKERDIIRRVKRNLRMAEKVQEDAERSLSRYHRETRREKQSVEWLNPQYFRAERTADR